jgi:hypothetical protein
MNKLRWWRLWMPSVVGLLEQREFAARHRVDELREETSDTPSSAARIRATGRAGASSQIEPLRAKLKRAATAA